MRNPNDLYHSPLFILISKCCCLLDVELASKEVNEYFEAGVINAEERDNLRRCIDAQVNYILSN